MAFYSALPQYRAPDPLDWSPVERGMNALGGYYDRQSKQAKFDAMFADQQGPVTQGPGGWETQTVRPNRFVQAGINPAMVDLARTMGYELGPNALMGAYQQQQQRDLAILDRDLRERQFERQSRQTDQQLRLQHLQENRLSAMTPYDIAIKKAQAENSQIDTDMMRGLMRPQQPPPNAAGPPSVWSSPSPGVPGTAPPLPGGVPTPAPPSAAVQRSPLPGPTMPAEPQMIQTPFGLMPIEDAHRAMGLLAMRGKTEAAKLMKDSIDNADTSKDYRKAYDKERGEGVAKAADALPVIEQQHKFVTGAIDGLLRDPALDWSTGVVNGKLPSLLPGARRVDEKFDQIKGQAFLTAVKEMRGLGALTETEGQKAQAAISRLNQAKSSADVREALIELKGVVDAGLVTARRRAGQSTTATTPNAAPASGRRLRFDQETGEIK